MNKVNNICEVCRITEGETEYRPHTGNPWGFERDKRNGSDPAIWFSGLHEGRKNGIIKIQKRNRRGK